MKPTLYISFLIFCFLSVSCTTTKTIDENEKPIKTVKGILVDPGGFEQRDCEIRLKGTERTTITGIDGKFEIEATKGDILQATNIYGEVAEYYISNPNIYIRLVCGVDLLDN